MAPIAAFLLLCLTICPLQAHPKNLKLKDIFSSLTDAEQERIFGNSAVTSDGFDVIHPIRVDERGNYISHDLSHGNELRQRSLGSGKRPEPVFFRVPAFGRDLHIKASLNTELLSPQSTVEVVGTQGSRREETIENCHYTGHVFEEGKRLDGKAAISNCNGLSGMIVSDEHGVLMVNPLPERLGLDQDGKRAHVIVKRSARDLDELARGMGVDERSNIRCGVKDDDSKRPVKRSMSSPSCSNKFPGRIFYIEALVVVDYMMTNYHGLNMIKEYVPAILNVAHSLLADNTIGAKIRYIIKKLEIHETYQPGLYIVTDADATLKTFCEWSDKKNVKDDSNPNHFDHATLIARKKWTSGGNNALGLAPLSGMCRPKSSCTINQDAGLGAAFTIAHETGHSLGARHDGNKNVCPNDAFLMATKATGKASVFKWSSCSCNYVQDFLGSANSRCLNDKPNKFHPLPKATTLLGQMYDKDAQCRMIYSPSASYCSGIRSLEDKICFQLWCKKSASSNTCTSNMEPAAEGTECGVRKWCRQGRCIPFGASGPDPIDGGYAGWSGWGACSHSCGGGVKTRKRTCTNPEPKYGGKLCQGAAEEFKFCKTPKCPTGTPHTRTTQCKKNNDAKFSTDSGGTRTYDWRYDPKLNPAGGNERCALKCTSGPRSRYVTYTFGYVTPGTPCDGEGVAGVCVGNGKCERVGCDGVLRSTAIRDRCGVCNGDGSTCSNSWTNRTFTWQPDEFADQYQPITTIPAKARKIYIVEVSGSVYWNYLVLKSTSGRGQQLNTDPNNLARRSWTFRLAGTTFYYRRRYREMIYAPGPLTEPVELQFLVDDYYRKYSVKYAYITPRSTVLNKRGRVRFIWGYRVTEGCPICGQGTEVQSAVCELKEDNSLVDDRYCEDLPMPDSIHRPCKNGPCGRSVNSAKGEKLVHNVPVHLPICSD